MDSGVVSTAVTTKTASTDVVRSEDSESEVNTQYIWRWRDGWTGESTVETWTSWRRYLLL